MNDEDRKKKASNRDEDNDAKGRSRTDDSDTIHYMFPEFQDAAGRTWRWYTQRGGL